MITFDFGYRPRETPAPFQLQPIENYPDGRSCRPQLGRSEANLPDL
jgi:hypothetical protein